MSVNSLLSRWRAEPEIFQNISAWETQPARPAMIEAVPQDLHPELHQALANLGIDGLYLHQAEALRSAWEGLHPVVATSTASGKSLAYHLPVLDMLLRDPKARAIYVFPTKALAQDQLSSLNALLGAAPGKAYLPSISPAIYDGDTPKGARSAIRTNARLVLSNPDMLHTAILPHHTAWAELFRNLRYVVLDEIHVYRGVFGSHVANVFRRLKRIANFYNSDPQFILTSATIANPLELALRLVEPGGGRADLALIDKDGAPHGQKSFLIYNPPLTDPYLGIRRSAMQEAVRLAGEMLAYNVQTIVFARTRRSVELLLTALRQGAAALRSGDKSGGLHAEQLIRGYRSGYLPQQRREIESGLRNGSVRAVVATNALELGIDIGAMGGSLMVGYPGSIAAAWQQAGRAGRGQGASLAVLIATPDPLDQFLAAHPEYFFGRSPEQALINPDNLLILLAHIRCSAFELPFSRAELEMAGTPPPTAYGGLDAARLLEFLDFLVEQRVLHRSHDRYFWMADEYPAQNISLRSASADNIILQVIDGAPQVIGVVDRFSAYWLVHPQAIYLHEGQVYQVQQLDLEGNVAYLQSVSTDYYTEHRSESSVELIGVFEQYPIQGGIKTYGEIIVTNQVIGYRQVHWHTHQQLGLGQLDLPPTELQTTAYWITLSEETVSELQSAGLLTNAPNQYGPTWPRQRDRARARDGFRCQVCGSPETDRAHAVHHKIPFRTFGSAEVANQLENLVTLCANCHRRVETAVLVRSGLAGLGYVLGQLSPLFLMCDARDLGVHSDQQSPLSGGLPVVVLYDQTPAGIGLSQRLFEIHSDLIGRARELVSECPCTDGCPSCVGPGGENGLGSKRETLAILDLLGAG